MGGHHAVLRSLPTRFDWNPPEDWWQQSRRVKRLLILTVLACRSLGAAEPCRIEVVDADGAWPVPRVELRTVHKVRFVTDNAGVIAFDLPELMDTGTWFHVEADGYSVPRDGFGFRGVRLQPGPGARLRVEVQRDIVARRLGRLTGAGLFAECQRFGEHPDHRESGLLGCDSVLVAAHRGQLFWFWGDTNLARYPLGVFHTTGATTPLNPFATNAPPLRIDYDHVRDEHGRPREVARMPGDGPTWLTGLASLPDTEGRSRLVASYAKIKPPLDAYEWGLCVWNDEDRRFRPHRVVWTRSAATPSAPPLPRGHPARDGDWLYFGDPFPDFRCPATYEAWNNPATWEALDPQAELRSAAGDRVKPHRGSIAFHPHRGRWVTIFTQKAGKPSFLGEVWYAEAPAPTGPWGTAVKVLSHRRHSFYNPRMHPESIPADADHLLFEGTYSATFGQGAVPTPRHDYNQVLYRLDLDDPRLRPAAGGTEEAP